MSALRAWWDWLQETWDYVRADPHFWPQRPPEPHFEHVTRGPGRITITLPSPKKKGRPRGWFAALPPEAKERARQHLREAGRASARARRKAKERA